MFPVRELNDIIDFLRGKSTKTWRDMFTEVLDVIVFFDKQFQGADPIQFAAAPAHNFTSKEERAQAVEHFRDAVAARHTVMAFAGEAGRMQGLTIGGASVAGLDWKSILKILLSILSGMVI